MRIKQYERADGMRPPSLRPKAIAQEAQGEKEPVSVMLSREVRAFAGVLTHDLPEPLRLLAHDLLTPADRALVTWAYELAQEEGIDVAEVGKLVVDLTRHRMLEQQLRDTGSGALSMALTQAMADELGAAIESPLNRPSGMAPGWMGRPGSSPLGGARTRPFPTFPRDPRAERAALREGAGRLLGLAMLSDADEGIARAILTSPAMRDTSFDPAFIRTLLDPSAAPTRAVSLSFVQRLMTSLAPTIQPEGGSPSLTLDLRDARASLANAFSALALPASELEHAGHPAFVVGSALLRTRTASLFGESARGTSLSPRAFLVLTRADRALLRAIYAAEHGRGRDLRAADDVVLAVVRFRTAERKVNAEVLPPLRARQAITLAPSVLPRASIPAAPLSSYPAPSDDPDAPRRSFGSVAQMAERLFGTVRRLAPSSAPSVFPSGFPPALLDEATARASAAAVRERASVIPTVLPRPMDLAQALGLSVLVAELEARARRARRLRLSRRRRGTEGDERHATELAPSTDGSVREDAPSRRRAHWRLFLARKRARPVQE